MKIFNLLINFLMIMFAIHAIAEDKSICIIGAGDIMPGTNYPSADYLPPDDGKNLFETVKDILKSADVTVGNLEGSFLNQGEPAKLCKDPAKCYIFRIPEHYVNLLTDAGFDALSIANNHVGDFGNTGREKTVQTLKNAGLHFAGLVQYPFTVFETNGIKYGFCAFAPNAGTMDIRDIDGARQLVKKLKSMSDIVIVSFHGGAEGASHRHVTRETEFFYEENRGNVYEFAHNVIDAGADVILGHGPHITRAVELYKNRFIAYSLGNFCTYGRFNLREHNGVAPVIKIYLNRSGEFIQGKIYPIKQEKPGGPQPDHSRAAIKEIKALTKADFPETRLTIHNDGRILKTQN